MKYPSVINAGITGSQLLDGTADLNPVRFADVSVRFMLSISARRPSNWHRAKEPMLGEEKMMKKWCNESVRNSLFNDDVTC